MIFILITSFAISSIIFILCTDYNYAAERRRIELDYTRKREINRKRIQTKNKCYLQ